MIAKRGGVVARIEHRPHRARHRWIVRYCNRRLYWWCLHNSEIGARRCVARTLNEAARRAG